MAKLELQAIGCAGGSSRICPSISICVEPISKSPEEDKEAGELNKAQEVLGVVLPTKAIAA